MAVSVGFVQKAEGEGVQDTGGLASGGRGCMLVL